MKIDEKRIKMKSKLVHIEKSIHLAKEWLELISRAKIHKSDKETCQRIIKCLTTAKTNMNDIKKLLDTV